MGAKIARNELPPANELQRVWTELGNISIGQNNDRLIVLSKKYVKM